MKLNKWYGLSLRVVALFATAMLVSFSPDYLRGFFCDIQLLPDKWGYISTHGMIDEYWDWGYRHFLYFYMCLILFFIQAARLIMWVHEYKDEFKP